MINIWSFFLKKNINKIIEIPPIIRKDIYELQSKINVKNNDYIKILVVGGSQGASFFDEKITNLIIELSKEYKIKIVQQVNNPNKINNIKNSSIN